MRCSEPGFRASSRHHHHDRLRLINYLRCGWFSVMPLIWTAARPNTETAKLTTIRISTRLAIGISFTLLTGLACTTSASADRAALTRPTVPAHAAGTQRACFVLGNLIKAMMALKGKGRPTEEEIQATVLGQVVDSAKTPHVKKAFDDVKAMGLTDDKLELMMTFNKMIIACPEVKPLAGMLKNA
jgi:hypothetical protein